MIRKKANVLSVGEEFTLSRAEAERRLKIEPQPSRQLCKASNEHVLIVR